MTTNQQPRSNSKHDLKTVIVTGVAGFIASKVAEILLKQGVKVIGIDNLNDYYSVDLKKHRLSKLTSNNNFSFYHIDIENKAELDAIANQLPKGSIQAVINLAARAGVRYSMINPHVYLSTNALGTLNLLELCRDYQINKFTLASTSSLYAGCSMPFSEELPVNEPISPYAATKKAAEAMCYSYHSLYNLDISVVRYFTVFGPGGRPDMSIFRFIEWIKTGHEIELFGDGSQTRDFTYVDDIAAGTIKATQAQLGYEVINLGGGRNPVSLLQVIKKLEQLIGKEAKINFKPAHQADLKETWAQISKAKSLLSWSPKINLDEGLEQSVAWHQQNSYPLCNN